jgi:hypothetical protein
MLRSIRLHPTFSVPEACASTVCGVDGSGWKPVNENYDADVICVASGSMGSAIGSRSLPNAN